MLEDLKIEVCEANRALGFRDDELPIDKPPWFQQYNAG